MTEASWHLYTFSLLYKCSMNLRACVCLAHVLHDRQTVLSQASFSVRSCHCTALLALMCFCNVTFSHSRMGSQPASNLHANKWQSVHCSGWRAAALLGETGLTVSIYLCIQCKDEAGQTVRAQQVFRWGEIRTRFDRHHSVKRSTNMTRFISRQHDIKCTTGAT